jgi:anaphase-promoting complex subunit 2
VSTVFVQSQKVKKISNGHRPAIGIATKTKRQARSYIILQSIYRYIMFIENQHVHVRVPLCSEDDLKRTLEKVKSYSQQHSTKASQLFFQDWKSHQDEDDDDDPNNDSILWKTLPLRIDLVTQFYLKNPELAITETRSIHLCSDDPMQSRRLALTASIISSAPRNLWLNFARLFQEILNTKCRAMEESMEESDDDDDSEGEEKEVESLDFDEKKLYQNLKTLKWLDGSASQYQAIISRPLSQALQSSIFKHVSEHIAGEFEDDTLFASLLEWKTSVLHPFLMDVLCCSSTTQQASPNVLEVWDHKLNHTIAECFCQVRKGELFDMIRDYPDSLPGIQDLNKALQLTRMTSQLMDSLKGSFQQRLLHPGVETGQILQIYINTIKVLRVMDPTDGLLESVATGIRSYLRGRADTVRNIITRYEYGSRTIYLYYKN